ncbi:MAG TPA: class I SAM-dependent methyltransferase, partial [Enhygromyxa sp.]|nr:class I SAM-dependent methyltransferase [Enhygromyxa sp.]
MSEYPARLYAAVHDGNPGDVEFYRRRCAGARSIVELGCGDARVLAALAEPGRRLVGVDIDPELLELARVRLSA